LRVFLDTNIPMYAAGREHPAKAPCVALLRRIADGEMDAVVDAEVLQEILHRFSAIGRLKDGFRLFDAFECVVREVIPVEHRDVAEARALLGVHPKITARDAIHAAVIRRHEIGAVYSYDKHLDGIEGVRRREPE